MGHLLLAGGGAIFLVVVVVVVIGMGMAPVPVLRLLVLVRLRVFVSVPVVFGEVLVPGAVLVVVPVVIVLVLTIVDADLNAGLLRCGRGHDGEWCGKGCGEEKRCDVMMWSVHVVSKVGICRGWECGSYECALGVARINVSFSSLGGMRGEDYLLLGI